MGKEGVTKPPERDKNVLEGRWNFAEREKWWLSTQNQNEMNMSYQLRNIKKLKSEISPIQYFKERIWPEVNPMTPNGNIVKKTDTNISSYYTEKKIRLHPEWNVAHWQSFVDLRWGDGTKKPMRTKSMHINNSYGKSLYVCKRSKTHTAAWEV